MSCFDSSGWHSGSHTIGALVVSTDEVTMCKALRETGPTQNILFLSSETLWLHFSPPVSGSCDWGLETVRMCFTSESL